MQGKMDISSHKHTKNGNILNLFCENSLLFTDVFQVGKLDLSLPTSGCIIASVNGIRRQCGYPEQSAENHVQPDSSGTAENKELSTDPKTLLVKSHLLPPLVLSSLLCALLAVVTPTNAVKQYWSQNQSEKRIRPQSPKVGQGLCLSIQENAGSGRP